MSIYVIKFHLHLFIFLALTAILNWSIFNVVTNVLNYSIVVSEYVPFETNILVKDINSLIYPQQ